MIGDVAATAQAAMAMVATFVLAGRRAVFQPRGARRLFLGRLFRANGCFFHKWLGRLKKQDRVAPGERWPSEAQLGLNSLKEVVPSIDEAREAIPAPGARAGLQLALKRRPASENAGPERHKLRRQRKRAYGCSP